MKFNESIGHRREVWCFIAILFVTYCQQSVSYSMWLMIDVSCLRVSSTVLTYVEVDRSFGFGFGVETDNNRSFGMVSFSMQNTQISGFGLSSTKVGAVRIIAMIWWIGKSYACTVELCLAFITLRPSHSLMLTLPAVTHCRVSIWMQAIVWCYISQWLGPLPASNIVPGISH